MAIASRIVIAAFGLLIVVATGCSTKSDNLPPFKPRPGSLEFCIVANERDDEDAFTAAREYFESAGKDPTKQAELKKLAEEGKPPPAPAENPNLRFSLNGNDTTFRWLKLDANFIKASKLGPHHENEIAKRVFDARGSGLLAIVELDPPSKNAIWSRRCLNASMSAQERSEKGAEYFILIRNASPGKEVTEVHLSEIAPGIEFKSGRNAIDGKFNEEGAERFHELTTENVKNQLAIIIQSKVFIAPTLNGPIADRFQITGDFSLEYVNEVVSRIRTAGQ